MGKQKKKVKANSGNNKNKRGNEKNDNSRKEEIRDKSDNQNEDKNNSRKNINGDKENNKKDTDDKDENRKNSDDKDQDDKNQDEDEEKEDKKTKDDNKQEDESRNDRELKKEDDLDGAKKLEKEVIDEKIDTVNEAELEEKKAAEIEVEEKKATETEVEEKKATEIEVAVEEKYAKEKIIEEPTKVEKTKMVQFQRTFLQPDSSLGWPNLLKMFGPRNLLSKGRKQEEVASKENVVTNSSDVAPRSSLDSAHTSKSNFELDFAETSNQLGTSKNNLQPESNQPPVDVKTPIPHLEDTAGNIDDAASFMANAGSKKTKKTESRHSKFKIEKNDLKQIQSALDPKDNDSSNTLPDQEKAVKGLKNKKAIKSLPNEQDKFSLDETFSTKSKISVEGENINSEIATSGELIDQSKTKKKHSKEENDESVKELQKLSQNTDVEWGLQRVVHQPEATDTNYSSQNETSSPSHYYEEPNRSQSESSHTLPPPYVPDAPDADMTDDTTGSNILTAQVSTSHQAPTFFPQSSNNKSRNKSSNLSDTKIKKIASYNVADHSGFSLANLPLQENQIASSSQGVSSIRLGFKSFIPLGRSMIENYKTKNSQSSGEQSAVVTEKINIQAAQAREVSLVPGKHLNKIINQDKLAIDSKVRPRLTQGLKSNTPRSKNAADASRKHSSTKHTMNNSKIKSSAFQLPENDFPLIINDKNDSDKFDVTTQNQNQILETSHEADQSTENFMENCPIIGHKNNSAEQVESLDTKVEIGEIKTISKFHDTNRGIDGDKLNIVAAQGSKRTKNVDEEINFISNQKNSLKSKNFNHKKNVKAVPPSKLMNVKMVLMDKNLSHQSQAPNENGDYGLLENDANQPLSQRRSDSSLIPGSFPPESEADGFAGKTPQDLDSHLLTPNHMKETLQNQTSQCEEITKEDIEGDHKLLKDEFAPSENKKKGNVKSIQIPMESKKAKRNKKNNKQAGPDKNSNWNMLMKIEENKRNEEEEERKRIDEEEKRKRTEEEEERKRIEEEEERKRIEEEEERKKIEEEEERKRIEEEERKRIEEEEERERIEEEEERKKIEEEEERKKIEEEEERERIEGEEERKKIEEEEERKRIEEEEETKREQDEKTRVKEMKKGNKEKPTKLKKNKKTKKSILSEKEITWDRDIMSKEKEHTKEREQSESKILNSAQVTMDDYTQFKKKPHKNTLAAKSEEAWSKNRKTKQKGDEITNKEIDEEEKRRKEEEEEKRREEEEEEKRREEEEEKRREKEEEEKRREEEEEEKRREEEEEEKRREEEEEEKRREEEEEEKRREKEEEEKMREQQEEEKRRELVEEKLKREEEIKKRDAKKMKEDHTNEARKVAESSLEKVESRLRRTKKKTGKKSTDVTKGATGDQIMTTQKNEDRTRRGENKIEGEDDDMMIKEQRQNEVVPKETLILTTPLTSPLTPPFVSPSQTPSPQSEFKIKSNGINFQHGDISRNNKDVPLRKKTEKPPSMNKTSKRERPIKLVSKSSKSQKNLETKHSKSISPRLTTKTDRPSFSKGISNMFATPSRSKSLSERRSSTTRKSSSRRQSITEGMKISSISHSGEPISKVAISAKAAKLLGVPINSRGKIDRNVDSKLDEDIIMVGSGGTSSSPEKTSKKHRLKEDIVIIKSGGQSEPTNRRLESTRKPVLGGIFGGFLSSKSRSNGKRHISTVDGESREFRLKNRKIKQPDAGTNSLKMSGGLVDDEQDARAERHARRRAEKEAAENTQRYIDEERREQQRMHENLEARRLHEREARKVARRAQRALEAEKIKAVEVEELRRAERRHIRQKKLTDQISSDESRHVDASRPRRAKYSNPQEVIEIPEDCRHIRQERYSAQTTVKNHKSSLRKTSPITKRVVVPDEEKPRNYDRDSTRKKKKTSRPQSGTNKLVQDISDAPHLPSMAPLPHHDSNEKRHKSRRQKRHSKSDETEEERIERKRRRELRRLERGDLKPTKKHESVEKKAPKRTEKSKYSVGSENLKGPEKVERRSRRRNSSFAEPRASGVQGSLFSRWKKLAGV